MASGVDTVLGVLERAGFQRLPKPLVIAGTAFDFDAAVTGTKVSQDLVVVSSSSSQPTRLIQLLSALSRTLDRLQSRRPVSLVLLGRHVERSVMTELENHARIMMIESEAPADEEVQTAIAVLLPLRLPSTTRLNVDPLEELETTLGSAMTDDHRVLIEAARVGPDAVRKTLRRFIADAVEASDDEDVGS